MATTTPNFGWTVPTSSDLVKNGAVAIETLGDSIDASMAELKGGTTGQVLSKTSNTDMDFTWTTASGGSSYVAGKNAFYNSAFDIWQRGTSSIGTAYNYTADRWLNFRSAFSAGATFSRVASTQTGFQYALKSQRDLVNANTDTLHLRQALETTDSLRFAGQTVTISFYAKAGANFSSGSSILISTIYAGEGTDQAANNMTAWTGVSGYNQNNTLTTSWQRFTQTQAIGSTKTQIGLAFTYNPTGIAGADDSYQITGVQIETAATASGFSRQAGSIQGELAACQRYYQRLSGSFIFITEPSPAFSSGLVFAPFGSKTTFRAAPSSVDFSGALKLTDTVNEVTVTAILIDASNVNRTSLRIEASSGLTQFRPYALSPRADVNSYVGLSAEL
jgi:hypothetical protein